MVLEEGNQTRTRCPKFDMFVMWRDLNGTHQATPMCARGVERWMEKLWEDEAWMSMPVVFEAYVRPLEMVTALKYIGRILTASDNEWTEVM